MTLPLHVSTLFEVSDSSQVGEGRRHAAALAKENGLDETSQGRVSIVVAELANNLVKHAGGGVLVLRALRPLHSRSSARGLEILSVDRGPGMRDIERCLEDGYSTAGSPGTGLGAIKRLSAFFDIYAPLGKGCVIVSQVWTTDHEAILRESPENLECGAVCLPNRGEVRCGDAWEFRPVDGRNALMVADGLGHGPLAAEASEEALRVFSAHVDRRPGELLTIAHGALKKTRGAAVSVLELDPAHRSLTFAGVGNVAAAVIDPRSGTRRMANHNGTVGLAMSRAHEFTYPWSRNPSSVLVMHSDGLSSHWKLEEYAGILNRHPSIIAGVLYRDFMRGTDDLTVVVAKERET